nr:hypothetical protein [Burkholderia gladioli]
MHNRYVVAELEAKGAIFVNELASVPRGSLVIFSAHGVSRHVEHTARARELDVIDAPCPMVSKVHAEEQRYTAAGRTVILIGHAGHAEIIGTLGQIPGPVKLIATVDEVEALSVDDPEKLAYITQTTLSVNDTRAIVEASRTSTAWIFTAFRSRPVAVHWRPCSSATAVRCSASRRISTIRPRRCSTARASSSWRA